MSINKTSRRGAVSGIAIALMFSVGASSMVNAEPRKSSTEAMIKYRHLFMETKGNHSQAIKLLVKKKLSYSHIIAHAEALAAMADDMLTLFPAGSMSAKSRALPAIWNDDGTVSAEFIKQTEVMRSEAKKMVEVAQEGNYKKIKKQVGKLAKNGCRGCHTDFRGEESE
ncbi:hypothetical protein A9Q99_18855 [Gammaproteobacteria bacterium 45_16_T64]|nr:hypothetical protein A9Q99_18855 [Gammaproteobacteria bacterium 45_16_T64]